MYFAGQFPFCPNCGQKFAPQIELQIAEDAVELAGRRV